MGIYIKVAETQTQKAIREARAEAAKIATQEAEERADEELAALIEEIYAEDVEMIEG